VISKAFRMCNKVLGGIGLGIQRVGPDFINRPIGSAQTHELARRLADAFDQWKSNQDLFEDLRNFDSQAAVHQFYKAYLQSPFRTAFGGSRLNNLVLLYLFARSYRPTFIVDSGTFQGASAWALKMGAPEASVVSFDIDLSRMMSETPGVTYVESDWASFDFATFDLSRSVAFFDDHIDQVRRLKESAANNIKVLILDDDLEVGAFAGMAHGGMSIPKIEFVFDPFIASLKEINWFDGKKEKSWPVDHQYLAEARGLINKYSRFPNTSAHTGIWQLPYSLLTLR